MARGEKLVAVAVAAALLASSGTAGAAPLQSLGQGEGAVDIVAWPGYIERGETDKAYDWVTGFEQRTGCKVSVKTAGTSDEMVALMNEGGFDLVTASGDASLRLIAGKTVQGGEHRAGPLVGHGGSQAPERALAHGRRQALRRALPVGQQRADVRQGGLQGRGAEVLERRVRGAAAPGRQAEQGQNPGDGLSLSLLSRYGLGPGA